MYEEMNTLLVQIKADHNSRRLCPITKNLYDLNYIPGHFLIGGPLAVVPEPSSGNVKVSRLFRSQFLR